MLALLTNFESDVTFHRKCKSASGAPSGGGLQVGIHGVRTLAAESLITEEILVPCFQNINTNNYFM